MSPNEIIKDKSFIKQQLDQTTYDLFHARSVRESQFLQQKLDYLKKKMKDSKVKKKRK